MTGYDDGRVQCTDQELVIRHYYLTGGAKHISYTEILNVVVGPLSAFGKWRIHGSNDLIHWFNFDPRRPRKETAMSVHTAHRIIPVITPDRPEEVAAALTEHGVTVGSGSEAGIL